MIQEYSERNATSGHRVSLRVMVRGSLEATLTIEYRKETYMIVREYLDGINPEQYHIFDSHQEMMGDRGVDDGKQKIQHLWRRCDRKNHGTGQRGECTRYDYNPL